VQGGALLRIVETVIALDLDVIEPVRQLSSSSAKRDNASSRSSVSDDT
jgi:hypothetical protein